MSEYLWQEEKERADLLQARVDELETRVEELKRGLKIANTFAVSRRKVIADLQTKVDKLEGVCAITGIIEREKKYIATEAKVERYRKCLQRIVDEGWDRYGCAEALKQAGAK